MHYGVYGSGSNQAVLAIRDGLRALGHKVTLQRVEVWAPYMARTDFDRVVVNGLRGNYTTAWQHHRAEGLPVIIREAPHFRGLEDQKRMSVTEHAWIPSFPCPPDRLQALGVRPVPLRDVKSGGTLLVCGQTDGDTQHGLSGDQIAEWLGEAAAVVAQEFNLRPEWRPHPMARDLPRPDGVAPESSPGEPILEALGRCSAMLSYNSTTGIEALRVGCPVFHGGPATYAPMAHRVTGSAIEAPSGGSVEALLSRVAYTQWSYDELRSGAWVEIVEKELSGDHSPLPGAKPETQPATPVELPSEEPARIESAQGWPAGRFNLKDLADLRGISKAVARKSADEAVDAGALVLVSSGGRGRHNPRLYEAAS